MMLEITTQILEAKHCLAFTGVGISTLSGITDFRGVNGLFAKKWRGYNGEELFDIDFFRQHPDLFYEFSKDFLYRLEDKKPSIVHQVLAKLQQKKLIGTIYTQNIDMLHQQAGSIAVEENPWITC